MGGRFKPRFYTNFIHREKYVLILDQCCNFWHLLHTNIGTGTHGDLDMILSGLPVWGCKLQDPYKKRNMKFEDEQGTALSSKVHELKKEGKTYQIETKIIREAQVYKVGDSNCDLCLTEKLCIALNHKAPVKLLTLPKGCGLLNIWSEEMSGCNHRIDCRLIGRRKPTQRNS